jgi:FkbM family methyltransferase
MYIRKLLQLVGFVAAPIVFTAYRITKSSHALRATLYFDPTYSHALEEWVIGRRASVSDFQQLVIASQFLAYLPPETSKPVRFLVSLSHSALLQDVLALLMCNERREGYFVEVGVGSGIHISNTFMLEDHFSWRGLLVEPNRAFHESIRSCRKAQLIESAAFSESGIELNFEATKVGEYSGLSKTIQRRGTSDAQSTLQTYLVKTSTLNEILTSANAPSEIDYMSIDTEGSEFEILLGLDLSKWKIRLFTIEHNFDPEKTAKIERYLFAHGYEKILSTISKYDGFYINRSVVDHATLK